MDMDISMDIHAKSVDMDMDMDGKFHIYGNPGNFTQSIPIALVSREQDRLQCAPKDTVAYSRFTQFDNVIIIRPFLGRRAVLSVAPRPSVRPVSPIFAKQKSPTNI